MPTLTDYGAGSVFTVKPTWDEPVRRFEVVPGPVDTPPNEPWFHLAVVQFEDSGARTSPSQVDAAVAAVRMARQSSPNGVIVVTFIHGWHHGAAWKRTPSTLATDPDGDDHFHAFRLVLESLALRELERPGWRRVVGIYLSWNGDPIEGVGEAISDVPVLTHTTFKDRYAVAKQIGESPAFHDTLLGIISAAKNPVPLAGGDAAVAAADSPLIMIGHSMGALMLESGLLTLLEEHAALIRSATSSSAGAVQLKSEQGLISFPDLILALNSAADSRIAKSILEGLEWQRLTKTATAGDISFSPPILMSVTSAADGDTKNIWRLAQGVFAPWRQTDGHDESLITHDFNLTASDAVCLKQPDVRDFGQNWHCLRRPLPASGAGSPAIPVDLPVRDRTGVKDEMVPHARYTITPRGEKTVPRLMWVFQVPREVIQNHNDIFNSQARALILALIQISGAVASLATNWAQSFEAE